MALERLFIVRHGDTPANEKGIEAGTLPYTLTKKGKKDAKFIAKALSKIKIDAIYSSPILRAVETAKILAEPHDLKVRTMEELTDAKLKQRFVGKKGRHQILTDPSAFTETNEQLLDRAAKAFEMIGKRSKGNVIVVSHGDVITAMLENVVERKLKGERYYVVHPESASLCIVDVKTEPVLMLYNYHRKQLASLL
jgi:broad specificity phosphatase PhoE